MTTQFVFHTIIVALSQSQEMVLGKLILKETSMKYFFWDLGHWHPLVFPVSQMNVMVKKNMQRLTILSLQYSCLKK